MAVFWNMKRLIASYAHLIFVVYPVKLLTLLLKK